MYGLFCQPSVWTLPYLTFFTLSPTYPPNRTTCDNGNMVMEYADTQSNPLVYCGLLFSAFPSRPFTFFHVNTAHLVLNFGNLG